MTKERQASIGDNSKEASADDVAGIAAGQLRALVERIERVDSEIADLKADLKDVYAEAKGSGFDTKIMRKIIALRKKDAATRQEEEAILELYCNALGMQMRLPL